MTILTSALQHPYRSYSRFITYLSLLVMLSGCFSQGSDSPTPNLAPTAGFTVSTSSIDSGESVNFDASTSSDIDGSVAEYRWDFGDGSSATGRQVTHLYTTPGKYSVNLTVTDDAGAKASGTVRYGLSRY
ncbi:hypothetical protein BOW53_11190 [Solemya pervernicosa gill symbiont]|uniref:PKD domain-containing protein n=3 Tax=Gammaproteobacteria incertae sedis TaxID=118884 RepID=A0A1T2L386_9GAMM|nr:hypothetical protein BOW53_11190 [Solemya pervernicosa gill symbiont]QKQ26792.1 PKD domain-containing protein [Candidatus Reidiella endopervernicosa]